MADGKVTGYKVFDPNWQCRGKQYFCPGVVEERVKPEVCKIGMHFCKNLLSCFAYYKFDPKNHVAEVVAYGTVDEEGTADLCCTNKLYIVRELPWQEVLDMLNTGKGNTGRRNTGDYNSGNGNCGHWNSGDANEGTNNSGLGNFGNRNSGIFSSGHGNTGSFNIGDRNCGDSNLGSWNCGDWNRTDGATGCFNTEDQKMYFFNKPSNITYAEWRNSPARKLLYEISLLGFKGVSDMTDKEKEAHPTAERTGGYLEKTTDEVRQMWWDSLSTKNKSIILSIPNFDKDIFKEITGIDIEKKQPSHYVWSTPVSSEE